MKKVNLTKDISIRVLQRIAGKDGVVLVKQDAIGGRTVSPADGNIGDTMVNGDPYAVTILTYYSDDEYTYWVSSFNPLKVNNAFTYTFPFKLS